MIIMGFYCVIIITGTLLRPFFIVEMEKIASSLVEPGCVTYGSTNEDSSFSRISTIFWIPMWKILKE